jgi:response regulator NasT
MMKLSFLIAEDEALTRKDIKGILERAGYAVCGECGNGLKALELAKAVKPDMAILDIKMPGMDGIEVARVFHGLDIPVLLVTAYSQTNLITRAENVYVCGYLVKPISEQSLLAAVRIGYARWQDARRVSEELSATKDELRQQKYIARAKAILMDRDQLSAQEAHQLLTRESMRRRLPLAEMAKEIIGDFTK